MAGLRSRRLRAILLPLAAGASALALGAQSPARAADAATCDGQAVTIQGTSGGDRIVGTPGADVIAGGNGDDLIDAAGGADLVCGGNGGDTILGGDGDDLLLGGNGVDVLFGDWGEDVVDGGNGDDRISGDGDGDVLRGGHGDDDLDGGAAADTLDGDLGADSCVGGEQHDGCENVAADPDPLAAAAPAPAGTLSVAGREGVEVEIDSRGGIYPWEVRINVDPVLMRTVRGALASPVYDFEVPEQAPAFERARITIPYAADRLAGFPESDLRIYTFDEDAGVWLSAGDGQLVDTVNDTVTVTVGHFSAYAVLALDDEGWARYWATTPARCIPIGDPDEPGALALDLAFVLDESGSMQSNDPRGLRKTAAKEVVDRLAEISELDRVAVVSFNSTARTRIRLTALTTSFGVESVKAAIDAVIASGGTNIGAGVERGINELVVDAPAGRPRVLVLMTDGIGSYNSATTRRAVDEGIVIYTVGLGSGIDESLLRTIATATGGRYLAAPSAADLVEAFEEIGRVIRDDGTDTDGDGLTDCEEENGMLSTWGMFDTELDPTQNEAFIGDRLVTSDPNDADTDDDGLTDGEEMRGLDLAEPLDLRDFEATREEYAFLIEAGITKYFIMRSSPNDPETDGDGLLDVDELKNGVTGADGRTYHTRADRWDTDLDGANDALELEHGTDPTFPDANELGIPGLPRFTLFQPSIYVEKPVVTTRWEFTQDGARFVVFNRSPVVWGDDFACVENCADVLAAAEDRPGSWCWLPWSDCSTEAKARDLIREAVAAQAIFNEDGTFTGGHVTGEAVAECLLTNGNTDACTDEDVLNAAPDSTEGPSLDSSIAEVLMAVPGGYRPRLDNLCGRDVGRGGTYRLIDPATGRARYVGQTNDFARRRVEHANDPRYRDLEFQERYVSDNYQTRRGLEQRDYNDLWGDVPIDNARAQGSLNGQRPMASSRPDYDWRLELAQTFLDLCL